MKQDLTVHPISLKQIVENLDRIPEKTGKFGEPSNELSRQEKKRLMELMGKFNEYGKALRADQSIMETAKNLSVMAELAKKYAMNEQNMDFIQKETVQRDYKQVDNITKQFQKLAKECVSHLMQLNALYEDCGNVFERYYETTINEAAPVEEPIVEPEIEPGIEPDIEPGVVPGPAPRHPIEPDPGQAPRPKGRYEECATCGCGRPLDPHTNECAHCGCGRPNDNHGIPMTPGEEQDEYASGF